MSLLLTRHVDQYRIDVHGGTGFGPDGLGTGGLEPFADQFAMQPIMLDHQNTLHGAIR
jgi:hypothetical protein